MKSILKNRLFDILPYQLENFPRNDALNDKKAGKWRSFSSQEVYDIVEKVSLGLLKLGYGSEDKFAIISYNCAEWEFIDLGILQIGAADVPLYPNMNEANYKYIFNDSQVKLVFVENKELYQKVKNVLPECPSIEDVYSFEEIEGVKHWSELTRLAEDSLKDKLNEIKDSVTQEDLATIIYTSGTTGVPKGVMLTHFNILSDCLMVEAVMPHNEHDRIISFLPLCHIFERTAVYFYMMVGAAVYFAESIDKIGENIKEVKPNYFTTVPRVIEKIFDKIMATGRELKGVKKTIFGWSLKVANRYNPKGENSAFYNFKLNIARKLVFTKWQQALGGEVKGIISGAAVLQPRLGRIFTAAGIPIVSGYGLTETSPVLTCNRFGKGENYIGTVGLPIPGVEIRIADNGEILAKGPNVTKGYFNLPKETQKAFDDEGWFHTGDVGEWVEGKFLKITDRLKEVFKTSGGKYVAPQPIENKMKESFFIDNIMVIGEMRRFVAAIVVPDFEFIKQWCKKKCVDFQSKEELINSKILKDRIWQDIQKYNKRFDHIEQIKKFVLVSDVWSVETGELTPTLKLKRRVIKEKYKDLIEEIYSGENNKLTNY